MVLPSGAIGEVRGAGVAYGYGGVDMWMEVGVGVANGAGGMREVSGCILGCNCSCNYLQIGFKITPCSVYFV